MVATPSNALNITAAGIVKFDGTATFSADTVTQYDVLVGGASNAISSVGPGTSGQILQSAGNAANPAYSTSTYPTTNAVSTLLYASSANVMAALTTANDGVLVTSNTGVPSWLANSGTAGFVLTANTAAPPSWQVTSAVNITWTDEAVSFNAVSNNGYFITAAATATLPASPSQGQTIEFSVDVDPGTGKLTIQANTGQVIRIGKNVSASAGTAVNNFQGDSVTLVYRSSDTAWIASSVIGTFTVT